MPFIPFRPRENQFVPTSPATVANVAIVPENRAQRAATVLLPVATVTQGNQKTVANSSNAVATGTAYKQGTIASVATIAGPPPEYAFARFFLDRAIPPDTAQALAWLLDSLPHNPHLTPAQRAQAEAALQGLAEEVRLCRCAVLFSSSQP